MVVYTVYGGNPTGLFYHGSAFPTPPALRDSTWIHQGNGYDAQFYRFAAHDPLLRHGSSAYMDDAALRYRRILIPALAFLASPFGILAVDLAYLALVLAALGAGVWFTAALAELDRRSAWWGFLFLALPGTIASVDRALLDGPLCAAVAAFLYFHRRGLAGAMVAVSVAAPLLRETGLLLAAAAAGSALLQRQPRRLVVFVSCAVPFALWAGYVAVNTPQAAYGNIIARPVWGLFARLLEVRTMPSWPPAVALLIQSLDILAILALIAAVALGLRLAVRDWPSPPALLSLLFSLLALLLAAPSHLADPFGYLRPISPLLLALVLNALATRAWWHLLPPALTALAMLPGPAVTLLRAAGALR
ncbi:MAG: hypothetical protein JNK87_32570 [Bryobacterales bacterium]|nr:hypothetical protein [Bryobacterales bacterium]